MLILDDVVYTARVRCVARPRQVFSFESFLEKRVIDTRTNRPSRRPVGRRRNHATRERKERRNGNRDSVELLLRPLPSSTRPHFSRNGRNCRQVPETTSRARLMLSSNVRHAYLRVTFTQKEKVKSKFKFFLAPFFSLFDYGTRV